VIERGPGGNGSRRSAGRQQVFSAIRTPQYLYAQHENGEQELYDLARDPYELQSRHADPAYAQIRAALAARLAALRSCAGAACWQR
jgi:N-acetylglucosamine-6-sulfatase